MKKIAFLLIFAMLFSLYSKGNNVSISGLTYLSGSDQVRFNVSWDNSWRNTGTAGSTQNYDGVWVFVKFRHACAKDSTWPSASDYTHMWLSTTAADHTVPSGAALQLGTTNISGTDRGMGVFIYRNADGSGTSSFSNVTLKWAKSAQGITGTDWDIQVFAIEMVNIPQGSYALGDGYSSSSLSPNINYYEFTNGNTDDPFLVASEDSLTFGGSIGMLNERSGTSSGSFQGPYCCASVTLGANTPKGYNAFWAMKYEVTQKQFVDFLNTLSRTNQRYMIRNYNLVTQVALNDTSVNDATTSNDNSRLGFFWDNWTNQRNAGNGITVAYTGGIGASNKVVPGTKPWTFACDLNNNGVFNESDDGLNTACNFLGGKMLFAYLDWAALRPMNELEFEKMSRGTALPQVDAFMWGSFGISANYTATGGGWSSARTSSETPTASTSSVGLVIASEGSGPRRVGSTNRTSTTRIQSGSSYYGVANLAGNVEEVVIRFSSMITGCYSPSCYICANYNRTAYGDGNITTIMPRSYYCDYNRWPAEWNCNSGNGSLGTRGGNWATSDASFFGISNRQWSGRCGAYGIGGQAWQGYSYGSPDGGFDGTSMGALYDDRQYTGGTSSSVMAYLQYLGGRGVR